MVVGFDRIDGFMISAQEIDDLFLKHLHLTTCPVDQDWKDRHAEMPEALDFYHVLIKHVRRDPRQHNWYLNPHRADQVYAFQESGEWEIIRLNDSVRAMYDKITWRINKYIREPADEAVKDTITQMRGSYLQDAAVSVAHGRSWVSTWLQNHKLPGGRPPSVTAFCLGPAPVIVRSTLTMYDIPGSALYGKKPYQLRLPTADSPSCLTTHSVAMALKSAEGAWAAAQVYGALYRAVDKKSATAVDRQEVFDMLDRKLAETMSEDPPMLGAEALRAARSAKIEYERDPTPIIDLCAPLE
jgi:hypothetical protein